MRGSAFVATCTSASEFRYTSLSLSTPCAPLVTRIPLSSPWWMRLDSTVGQARVVTKSPASRFESTSLPRS
jgi:hypothetical protein